MSALIWFVIGMSMGACTTGLFVLQTASRRRRADLLKGEYRPSVDVIIESALGHPPLPAGSTIRDVPRQYGRHRATESDEADIPDEPRDGHE